MDESSCNKSISLALEGMLEGIQIIDRQWRYVYVNQAAATHGRTEKDLLVGKTLHECYPGFSQSPGFKDLEYVMHFRKPLRVENLFTYPDGRNCWFELHIEPHPEGIMVRSLEITDRKLLEEQLRHSQRLEAIGQLAGGIAHEFNNKLGTMLMYSEMLIDQVKDNPTATEYINYVINAIEQSTTLTKKILAFGRKQVLDLEILNLNQLIKSMSPTLSGFFGEEVQVEYILDKHIENVHIDANQMEQAVLNLCLNARDAMSGPGRIEIETANVNLDEEFVRSHPNVKPGRYVMVAVSDNGHGMDKKTMARIFEPFFTTKERGKGTGLGLSMVHGFVNQSHGHIWAYSEVGLGSVFKIYLPAIGIKTSQETVEKPNVRTSYRGNETILLVEDDNLLRKAYELALTHAGYKVITAADGLKAKEMVLANGTAINLLLTDVVLPKLKGRELASEVVKVRPNIKVIFMSGYTENSIVHNGAIDSNAVLLQKPISIRNLLETVRKVLDGSISKGVI